MDTKQIVDNASLRLVPEDLRKELMAIQCVQEMLLGLIYNQRKYQRHNPDLGLAVWYGRAVRQLEATEAYIDRLQEEIKQYTSILSN